LYYPFLKKFEFFSEKSMSMEQTLPEKFLLPVHQEQEQLKEVAAGPPGTGTAEGEGAACPPGAGTAVDKEAAWPLTPGTADKLCLLGKRLAALID
jgi:hypothetical protein